MSHLVLSLRYAQSILCSEFPIVFMGTCAFYCTKKDHPCQRSEAEELKITDIKLYPELGSRQSRRKGAR